MESSDQELQQAGRRSSCFPSAAAAVCGMASPSWFPRNQDQELQYYSQFQRLHRHDHHDVDQVLVVPAAAAHDHQHETRDERSSCSRRWRYLLKKLMLLRGYYGKSSSVQRCSKPPRSTTFNYDIISYLNNFDEGGSGSPQQLHRLSCDGGRSAAAAARRRQLSSAGSPSPLPPTL